MTTFHNPYHFVPVKGEDGKYGHLNVDAFRNRDFGHVTHDRFVTETGGDNSMPVYSGRLICRLTTKDPVVVGRHVAPGGDDPQRVLPFELECKPAIPASSLRGLLSSIAEAASNSALRILENKPYTLRGPRERKRYGSTHEYFRRISSETLPFNQLRTQISIAEGLFGFVEENARDGQAESQQDGQQEQELALAGRIRPSFGLLYPDPGKENYYEDYGYKPLKILASPQPPLAYFYFKNARKAAFIPKEGLNRTNLIPQGRKFYLHHPTRKPEATPWLSERDDNLGQKVRVTPIHPGLSFYFHLDFVNLSQQELGMLCYAVQPTPKFRHKLGMGKPLGLGKVRIEPAGLFYIDRKRRYTESLILDEPRYHAAWVSADVPPECWPEWYATERKESAICAGGKPGFDSLRDSFSLDMDKDIRQALEILGNPGKVSNPVHTPQVAGPVGPAMEHETYRWFVENSKSGRDDNHQSLEPLNKDTTCLPYLKRMKPQERR